MIAWLLAVTNPGDELVIFEPYYENYGPDALLCGAERKYVKLHPPDWRVDPEGPRPAVLPRAQAIILTSPHQPPRGGFIRHDPGANSALCPEFATRAVTC